MKKILVFILTIALVIIGWIVFNNWRNRPENFIKQISAAAEITTETELACESAETEKTIRENALRLFPEWWPKGKLN